MENSILKLISGEHKLILPASDGSRLIYKAEDVFKGIDSRFVKWGINKPGIATPETPVQVYEVISNGKFIDIFSALTSAWSQKWISQNQLINFCETLPQWLRKEERGTFALIKKNEKKPINAGNLENNFVVVDVRVSSTCMGISVERLGANDIFFSQYRPRVIFPQLTSLII